MSTGSSKDFSAGNVIWDLFRRQGINVNVYAEIVPLPKIIPQLMQMRTGFLSEIGTKLRDWAIGQAGAG